MMEWNHCREKGLKEAASFSKGSKWKSIVPVKSFYPLCMTFRNKTSQICMKRDGRKRGGLREYVKGGEKNLELVICDTIKL